MFAKGTQQSFQRKRSLPDTDLDITPMIDVTFLLLIFFIVTSTMKATPDQDIPPAVSGDSAVVENFKRLEILSPSSPGAASQVIFDGDPVTLEGLQQELERRVRGGAVQLLIYAERDVRSGFVGEVEGVINEMEGNIEYKFAVRHRR